MPKESIVDPLAIGKVLSYLAVDDSLRSAGTNRSKMLVQMYFFGVENGCIVRIEIEGQRFARNISLGVCSDVLTQIIPNCDPFRGENFLSFGIATKDGPKEANESEKL